MNDKQRIYLCPWYEGTEEHEHVSDTGPNGGVICKVCGRCATCGLDKTYHTRLGANECVNALAKKLDELQGMFAVMETVAAMVKCRCGRPATEHQCGECYGI